MPTRDDQRAVQLDNARTDARVWEALSDAQADRIAGLKVMAAHAAPAVAKAEPAAVRQQTRHGRRPNGLPGQSKARTAAAAECR